MPRDLSHIIEDIENQLPDGVEIVDYQYITEGQKGEDYFDLTIKIEERE